MARKTAPNRARRPACQELTTGIHRDRKTKTRQAFPAARHITTRTAAAQVSVCRRAAA